MATAGQVIDTAQSVYLNDFNKRTWTSDQLFPFLQEAHRQMQVELQMNGIAVIKNQSFSITVPAIDSTWTGYVLMPTQPDNLIEPIRCYERSIGDTLNADWNLMTQKSFTPQLDPIENLVYWSWLQEKVVFLGATVDNDVKLEYNGGIAIPAADDDLLGFINAELYIAPKLAALASASIGGEKKSQKCEGIAAIMLDKILCTNVLSEQGMITRRRPYRHSRPQIIR